MAPSAVVNGTKKRVHREKCAASADYSADSTCGNYFAITVERFNRGCQTAVSAALQLCHFDPITAPGTGIRREREEEEGAEAGGEKSGRSPRFACFARSSHEACQVSSVERRANGGIQIPFGFAGRNPIRRFPAGEFDAPVPEKSELARNESSVVDVSVKSGECEQFGWQTGNDDSLHDTRIV
ncbi:hypothetical protein KM043_012850 [Ampulex compressa]|nr:hypothetical protein KM043_012850 [Ampulex compressa]